MTKPTTNHRPALIPGEFSLEVKWLGEVSRINTRLARSWEQHGGGELVTQAIDKAGLKRGPWQLLITEAIRGTGTMPRLSIRRPTDSGVILKIKPGANDTAVQATLIPPRVGTSPIDVYQRLSAAVNGEPERPALAVVVAKPEPVVAAAPETVVPPNTMDLLTKYQEKLRALANAPERIGVIRRQRQELATRLADLQREAEEVCGELDSLDREEAQLTSGIDVEALQLLLES